MKKSNLTVGLAFTLIGVVFLHFALISDSPLGGLLFGFAGGGLGAGLALICRYLYWNSPQKRARYMEKMAEEQIEQNDELKIKLRDRSGRYAYVLGLFVVSISMMVFSILGTLGIIQEYRIILLYLGGYLVFQIVVGIVIFNHLLKKY